MRTETSPSSGSARDVSHGGYTTRRSAIGSPSLHEGTHGIYYRTPRVRLVYLRPSDGGSLGW